MGACSFSSCRVNERSAATTGCGAAHRLDHEPDRGLLAAPGAAGDRDDVAAGRRRLTLAATTAGGRLPRSLPAHGRDHHATARPPLRGGRTAAHGPDRTGDERRAARGVAPVHLPLRICLLYTSPS